MSKCNRAYFETEMSYYAGSDKYDTAYNDALQALSLALAVVDAEYAVKQARLRVDDDNFNRLCAIAKSAMRACVEAGLVK